MAWPSGCSFAAQALPAELSACTDAANAIVKEAAATTSLNMTLLFHW
jgi:hypothetical protein